MARMEGNRFVLKDEHGSEVQRRYSVGEMLKIKLGPAGHHTNSQHTHVTLQGAKCARVVRIILHKECIAKSQAHAEKIINESKSKRPIALAVKNKMHIKTIEESRRPHKEHAWYEVGEMR